MLRQKLYFWKGNFAKIMRGLWILSRLLACMGYCCNQVMRKWQYSGFSINKFKMDPDPVSESGDRKPDPVSGTGSGVRNRFRTTYSMSE